MSTTEGITLTQSALFELRHIVIASGADALWVYRDPRVIGRKLLVSLVDAGLVEWSRALHLAYVHVGEAVES